MGGQREAGLLVVRGAEEDRARVRALAAALIAEGFRVKTTLRPLRDMDPDCPVVFVCSQANWRQVDFANEVRLGIEQNVGLIAGFEDLAESYLRNLVQHTTTVDFADWNGDRSFAAFRELVMACRRFHAAAGPDAALSVEELAERRMRAPVRSGRPDLKPQPPGDRGDGGGKPAQRPSKQPARVRGGATLDTRERSVFRSRSQRRADTDTGESWLRQVISSDAHRFDHDFDRREASRPVRYDAPPPPAPPARRQPHTELVDASVFAPKSARPGDHVLVQVFIQGVSAEQAAMAQRIARNADPDARQRLISTLDVEVADGQRIDVHLDGPGLTIPFPAQYLIWRRNPRACQFLVHVPAKGASRNYDLRAILSIDGIPVGALLFVLGVGPQGKAAGVDIRETSSARYRYAFVSYASPDRGAVYDRVQGVLASGIEVFQDRLSLEPGEIFKDRLQEELDRCDLFLLFWSKHAAKSKWVEWETRYALRRQKSSRNHKPYIRPMPLDGYLSPPKWLSHIHFHDRLSDNIVAHEVHAQARRKQSRTGQR